MDVRQLSSLWFCRFDREKSRYTFLTNETTYSDKADLRSVGYVTEIEEAKKRRGSQGLGRLCKVRPLFFFCKHATQIARLANAKYTIYVNGPIVKGAPVGGAVPMVKLQSLWSYLLSHWHHLVMAGYSGHCRRYMYMSRQKTFCVQQTTNYVCSTASNCSACARSRRKPLLKRQVQWFLLNDSLDRVVIHIFGPLLRIEVSKQYVAFITNRYCSLTRAWRTHKTIFWTRRKRIPWLVDNSL